VTNYSEDLTDIEVKHLDQVTIGEIVLGPRRPVAALSPDGDMIAFSGIVNTEDFRMAIWSPNDSTQSQISQR
jgi:hypothetical protein